MNLGPTGGDPLASLFFVQLNSDCSSVAVGTQHGFSLYSTQGRDGVHQIYSFEGSDVRIINRLGCSSLIALVSFSRPRLLRACHFKKGTDICSYLFPNAIVGVQLNRDHAVVILEEAIFIHSLTLMEVQHTIRDTPRNSAGLCALTCKKSNNYLAYPGSENKGEVIIFDTTDLERAKLARRNPEESCSVIIRAHNSPLAALAFSSDGKQLATASTKGTVIRIWSIPEGKRVKEFRRGLRPVTIYSLAFSPDSLYLASSSNTETVHIFRLVDPSEDRSAASHDIASGEDTAAETQPDAPQSWMGYFGSMVSGSLKVLPQQVTDSLQERAFATAKLPTSEQKTICSIGYPDRTTTPRVLVACSDGKLYTFTVNPVSGGECVLHKTNTIRHHDGAAAQREPTADQLAGVTGGLADLNVRGGSGSNLREQRVQPVDGLAGRNASDVRDEVDIDA